MRIEYIIFVLIGRLLIFFAQKFFKQNELEKRTFPFVQRLFSCNLCLGVWAYTILAFIFRLNALNELPYIPVLTELITGCVTSYLVHVIEMGWRSENEVIVIK
jgi:hypothetical protein